MPGIHRLIELVDETSQWLRSIGLDPEPTRFGVYSRALRRWIGKAPGELPHEAAVLAIEAIVPCLEIVQVHQHLAPLVDAARLKPRLERLLAGPPLEADENFDDGTNDARNMGFELVVGAVLAESGATVVLPDDGDLTVEIDGATAGLECKRVRSVRGLRQRVKRAGEQLAGRAGLPNNALRLVAVDASLLVRQPSHLIVRRTHDAVYHELKTATDKVLPKIIATCERVAGATTHGVAFYVAAPTHVIDSNFWGRAEHRHIQILSARLTPATGDALLRLVPALTGPSTGVRRP